MSGTERSQLGCSPWRGPSCSFLFPASCLWSQHRAGAVHPLSVLWTRVSCLSVLESWSSSLSLAPLESAHFPRASKPSRTGKADCTVLASCLAGACWPSVLWVGPGPICWVCGAQSRNPGSAELTSAQGSLPTMGRKGLCFRVFLLITEAAPSLRRSPTQTVSICSQSHVRPVSAPHSPFVFLSLHRSQTGTQRWCCFETFKCECVWLCPSCQRP